MEVSWPDIKALVSSGQTRLNFIERTNEYFIVASATNVAFTCSLEKGSADATEFENDFKQTWLHLAQPIDSDGSVISRSKTTRSGWHYEPRSIDFITSKAGSLYNRTHTGNTVDDSPDYGDAVLKFFDANGLELTQGQGESLAGYQARLDSYCTRTQADWQPTYEMDIIGATVSVLNPPTGNERAYCWVIVAPDIPANMGGSVPFMAGGWNLRFFTLDQTTFLDGRGVKSMPYDPVYNSNKIRVVVKHEPGAKVELQFVAEHFKA